MVNPETQPPEVESFEKVHVTELLRRLSCDAESFMPWSQIYFWDFCHSRWPNHVEQAIVDPENLSNVWREYGARLQVPPRVAGPSWRSNWSSLLESNA